MDIDDILLEIGRETSARLIRPVRTRDVSAIPQAKAVVYGLETVPHKDVVP